ncbi:MAG: hypothetical protein ACOYT7_00445 [Patescibacteria group bacterium]
MKLEEFLQELKEEYWRVRPPERVSLYGWLELRDRLEKKSTLRDIVSWLLVRPAVSVALSLVLLVAGATGLVVSAKESLPGETLYPVKRFYEDIATLVSGDERLKIEGRAQEIVILSQKEEENKERLKEAVIEYGVSVAEVKERVREDKREKLKATLKKHKEEFEKIYKESKGKREEIKKAIEALEHGD